MAVLFAIQILGQGVDGIDFDLNFPTSMWNENSGVVQQSAWGYENYTTYSYGSEAMRVCALLTGSYSTRIVCISDSFGAYPTNTIKRGARTSFFGMLIRYPGFGGGEGVFYSTSSQGLESVVWGEAKRAVNPNIVFATANQARDNSNLQPGRWYDLFNQTSN